MTDTDDPQAAADWLALMLKQAESVHMPIALAPVGNLRTLLDEREQLRGYLDTYHRALDRLVDAVRTACSFDGGEKNPEDAPWAAALDALDDTSHQILDGLIAAGLWA